MNVRNPLLRGLYFLWLTPFLILSSTYLMVPLVVALLLLPRSRYVHFAAAVQEFFIAAWVQCYEWNSDLKIYVSGDKLPDRESAMIISNHAAAHADWAPLYSLAARQHMLGGVKTVIKDEAKWIPGIGWAMWLLNWPFLKRNWKKDKGYLHRKLQTYAQDGAPLNMWLFPEGTRWTPKKYAAAVKYAKSASEKLHDWVPTETLVPKATGFVNLVQGLDGAITHIYDVTLAYTGYDLDWDRSKGPGHGQVFLAKRRDAEEVAFHIHVKRHALKDLPSDEQGLRELLFRWFREKDARLQKFKAAGDGARFPGAKPIKPLPSSAWMSSVITLFGLVLATYFVIARRYF